ncbi:recombinase [Vibrio sp. JCM 19236]|nr:recombinase [Vibrio sp. JCM 19236]
MPFWVDVTDDNMDFEINDKVEIVRQVFELSAKGLGAMKVAKHINAQGYKTARGKIWSHSNISVLLKNRNVLGEYQPCKVIDRKVVPQGAPVTDYYPQVITPELFHKVQLSIAERLVMFVWEALAHTEI